MGKSTSGQGHAKGGWKAALRWHWAVLRGEIWDKDLYCCLKCGRRLRRSQHLLSCRQCREQYPVIHGVPLLLRGMEQKPVAEAPSEASLKAVCDAYGLTPENGTVGRLREILSAAYEFHEPALEAENNYLLQRLAIDRTARPSVDSMAAPPVGSAGFATVRHYIPAELRPGELTSHNVRIRNTGTDTLKRHAHGGWELRANWRLPDHTEVGEAGKPSAFPIGLLPGRELTLPFWLRPPAVPGEYRLFFFLAAGGEVLQDGGSPVTVHVTESPAAPYAPLEPEKRPVQPDYDEDHRVGIRLLDQMVRARRSKVGLEIGGSSSPMTINLPCRIVNTDIDIQTMQVGRLVLRQRGHRNLAFACCDAARLPFGESTFDFAALFAALHHLADPIAALRSLTRVIKPDGFVAVMCEPVGHYYDQPDAEMQEVLEHGLNEQRFTLDEYARMFHEAGLVPHSCQLDHDSLKAILTLAAAT